MGLPGVPFVQIIQHTPGWKPVALFAFTHSLLLVSNVLLLFLLPNSPKSLVQGTIPTNLPTEMPQLIPVFPGGTPLLPPVVTASIPVSTPLPPASFGLVMDPTKQLSSSSVLDAFEPPPGGSGGSTLDSLDSLDLLPYTDSRLDALDSFGTSRGSLDALDSFAIGRYGVTGFYSVLPGKAKAVSFRAEEVCLIALPTQNRNTNVGEGRAAEYVLLMSNKKGCRCVIPDNQYVHGVKSQGRKEHQGV